MQTDLKQQLSIVAEVQLSYRPQVPSRQRPKITKAKDAYDLLLSVWDMDTIELSESFLVLLLNRANHVLGCLRISQGGITGTVVDVRIVFGAALKAAACGLILAHNHPSGNLNPSMSDRELTRKMVDAGKLLDINVLDHLIVTQSGYYSFADEGLI
jgi:DNA repair protein RadC